MELTPNAERVLEARYLRRDRNGRIIESAGELYERVARAVAHAELRLGAAAHAERWTSTFHDLLSTRDFLPNSPALMNAGTHFGQLSACFVIPVDDSMESIFEALKRMALIQRTGGGTGFSFSRLRPRGARTRAGLETPGPVSFMRVFDCATENIRLGGRRRGANMGVLRVDHPDIMEFITAKRDGPALRNFNISVAVTDEFMRAAGRGEAYRLHDTRTGQAVKRVDAAEVLDAIVDGAWRTGDPGLLFLDAIEAAHVTPALGPIEATNPCGEVPLLPFESCNLGSINLAHMLRGGAPEIEVDWDRLDRTVHAAVRFLDDVIEVNRYPFPEIERATRATRKIGLGVMGLAEMLIRLGIPYDTDAALELAERLAARIAAKAREASEELAEERGPFDAWHMSRLAEAGGRPIRNATRTAIAPTGTISIIADTTASIEPLFALAYRRTHVLEGQVLPEAAPLLREELERRAIDADRVLERVIEGGGLRAADLPPDLARVFVTALEIAPERHLAMQAAFQRHVDNAVSKTINLPADATTDDIARIYRGAWELGVKGITIYRYGSKDEQVLELGAREESFHYDHATHCDPTECDV